MKLSAVALLSIAPMTLVGKATQPGPSNELPLTLCEPTEDNYNSSSIDVRNEFFPLPPGQRWVFVGKEGSQNLALRITVLEGAEPFTFTAPEAITVSTRRVEETEWEDDDGDGRIDKGEFVIETSINYFAQTEEGTVCYFGEDVRIYQPGGGFVTDGSWRADQNGNAPGIFMPAHPQVGTTYQQEVATGVAEDRATIIWEGRRVRSPAATFTDTLGTRDFNPLDGSKGTKAYARGVGLIQDDVLLLLRRSTN